MAFSGFSLCQHALLLCPNKPILSRHGQPGHTTRFRSAMVIIVLTDGILSEHMLHT